MHAYVTVGAPCSGKSTFAATKVVEGYTEINRDDIREDIMLEKGKEPIWANWRWKWEDEVTRRWNAYLEEAAADGENIVISDTNTNPQRRATLLNRLSELGYETTVHHMEISFEEACARDAQRPNGTGVSAIAKHIAAFEREHENQVVYNPMLPDAVIIDVDGTVAKMKGRSPYDWDKVDTDEPNWVTIFAVIGLLERGAYPIVVSGRDGCCEELTKDWFERYAPELYSRYKEAAGKGSFYMRRAGDQRKDTIVKREIFDEHIRYNFNVVAVFDDRPSVCRMWRTLGLDVFQIGNPYIEF